jgi:hypothetical protein
MTAETQFPAEFPKILAPEPEHQKTVAGSLLGRVLGFGRAYALASVSWIAAIVALDRIVTIALEPPWLPEPERLIAARRCRHHSRSTSHIRSAASCSTVVVHSNREGQAWLLPCRSLD